MSVQPGRRRGRIAPCPFPGDLPDLRFRSLIGRELIDETRGLLGFPLRPAVQDFFHGGLPFAFL